MTDNILESVLASESVDVALNRVRLSGRDPVEVAAALRELADEAGDPRPAAARLAAYLADRVAELAVVHEWEAVDGLSAAANEALATASRLRTWPEALAVLRAHAAEFTQEDMFSVAGWHSRLAQRGVPASSSGIAVVICLGALLGGPALALAHAAWARVCEARSLERADFHLRRAEQIMARFPEQAQVIRASDARRAFRERHGLPRVGGPGAESDATVPAAAEDFDDDPLTLPWREARAYTLRETGRPAEALALLDETVSLTARYGDDGRRMRLLILRGLVYEDLGEYELGAGDYEAAARLAEESGDDVRRFEARNNAAASLLKQQLPLRAVAAFTRILRQIDASGSVGQRIAARNNLGLALSEADSTQRSLDVYREALALAQEHFGMPSPITVTGLASVYRRLGHLDEVRALSQLRLTDWHEHRDLSALIEYLTSPAADLSADDTRSTAESVLRYLLDEDSNMHAFTLAHALASSDTEAGRAASALATLDQVLTRFASIRAQTPSAIGAEIHAARIEFDDLGRREAGLRRLRSAVARVEQRLAQITVARDADQVLRNARPLYQALLERLLPSPGQPADNALPPAADLVEAFNLHEASRPATWTGARTTRLADLSRVLSQVHDEVVAVVSFVETTSSIGAFIVRGDDRPLRYLPLPVDPSEARAAAAEFSVAANGDTTAFPRRRPLDPLRPSDTPLPRFTDVMDRLGLFVPGLAGATVACVIPTESLSALPMSAVRSPSGQYLVQATGVVYQPSVTALVQAATSTRRSARDAPSRLIFVAGVAATEDRHPEFFEDDVAMFDGVGRRLESAPGEEATPARVVDGMRRADIVHVTCHGYVDPRDPLRSGLLLSDGVRRPSRRLQAVPPLERARFLLTVEALRAKQVQAELVTLRACSTARRSRAESNEEVATLLQALHLAGCRTILTSLWNVDQRSSQALLRSFYGAYLAAEVPVWQALARAQRAMIGADGPWSHVYHWGAFIASGDWR
jgi:tetratricopeptide (TPR) repeat protein